MRSEDERSFGADDPVARYWLHNCVGFRVRGHGVVDGIATDGDVVTTLEVRRLGGLGGTTRVSTERIESVDPWTETIVVSGRSREPREGPRVVVTATRSLAAVAVPAARSAAAVAVTAARAVAAITAIAVSAFFALVARLLLAAAAFTRKHAPGARERAGSFAATLAAVGHAYALEAARAYRAQSAAVKAWREQRRRSEWGDESPLTRAGDDEVDARRGEERVRPSRRVGR
jgi:hypothetical protein